jgi:hypothetical protein
LVFFSLTGLGRYASGVDLDSDELRIRLGWAFRMSAPRATVARAGEYPHWMWFSIGAHTDLRGRWLVNGSGRGLVRIVLSEPARGRSCGIPIKPREVNVSLDDPQGFLTALGAPALLPEETEPARLRRRRAD